ncbi:MAG TPA: cation diffusion facilitator family transporter [Anaerohalosphaeraceae bacterium]|jgi:cobalt-zinc-cadmium efflux system protein|nr:cation diffusion facilitator family transporter [Anaerohalosphaeraceae bacterium]HRT50543.1 cation diffusion facilitator family transporter [Anaerohalosphaeraceae bacterium]HRT86517.1 cation diffusion facilitator family transporter [Anaerohalosphaeraceae bacterium]
MHEHSHTHQTRYDVAFIAGVALNTAFIAVEVIFGLAAGSLALLSDAGHNLTDVAALLIAWLAAWLTRRRRTQLRTYGWRKASILGALLNAALLLVVVGILVYEAILRLARPAPVQGAVMMVVASIGVVINSLTAMFFFHGRRQDLNIRAAFIHMAADAAVSLGVVVAGAAILITGWTWLDPVVSLVILALILIGTSQLFREAFDLAMDAVPAGIDPRAVHDYLAALPGVIEVHDLHIWGMSTTEAALTAHLVKPDPSTDDALIAQITHDLQTRFRIGHPTIQWERPGQPPVVPH